jgi:hypothetical protein
MNRRSPVEKAARWKWHVRGNWDSREDRIPSAVWLGILWTGMILGFSLDAKSFLAKHPPLLLHLHAAVFTIWMFLLTAQVLLVVGDRVDLHRKLGWLLAAWACLMGVMGPVAVYTATMMYVKVHGPIPNPFMAVNGFDISCFMVVLAVGIAMRKNSAAHKRLMILSTVALADPGFNRFIGHVYRIAPHTPLVFFFFVFYGDILIIALMLGWDFYRGRLIRAHVIASLCLVACMYMTSVIYFWQPWRNLTLQWITSWAK